MENKIIKISLMSDLCVSTGEGYQSSVDQDVVYDKYGFPYIPAKRLRGCIRETALELVDFNKYDENVFKDLFGESGNKPSNFVLDNAYLENYDKMVKEINACDDYVLKAPQNVLSLYTYSRTNTKIDSETGAAERKSLRTTRVVKKNQSSYESKQDPQPMCFLAKLKYEAGIPDKESDLLEKAISLTKHIGINRTRGLGLVKMEILPNFDNSNVELLIINDDLIDDSNRCKITYTLHLNSNVICKSAEGNQTQTQDFIEGGKILGMLANLLGQEVYQTNIQNDDNLRASNAYIACDGKRCLPIDASFQIEKDQSFNKDGILKVKNMLYLDPEKNKEDFEKQLTPLSYSWSEGTILKDVKTEIRYHHSRPDDKSIGHAKGNGQGEFYQLNSIAADQDFVGYIIADKNQTKLIINAIKKQNKVRIGGGKNSEYGDVTINSLCVEKYDDYNISKDLKNCEIHQNMLVDEFQLKLDSPLVLYNDNLMPTADVKDFISYLSSILNVKLNLNKCFLKYETIGGFNTTWRKKKQTIKVLGKGTICYFTSKGVDLSRLKDPFIGERCKEGYGEITISTLKNRYIDLQREGTSKNELCVEKFIIPQLKLSKEIKDSIEMARKKAKAILVSQTSLSKFIIFFKEQNSLKDIESQISAISAEDKKNECFKILNDINELNKSFKEVDYKVYTREYISCLKYKLRKEK